MRDKTVSWIQSTRFSMSMGQKNTLRMSSDQASVLNTQLQMWRFGGGEGLEKKSLCELRIKSLICVGV